MSSNPSGYMAGALGSAVFFKHARYRCDASLVRLVKARARCAACDAEWNSVDVSLVEKPINHLVLPLLRDPFGGAVLTLHGDRFESPSSQYPIVNSIPRFVRTDHYVGSFSFEWSVHNQTQLDFARGDQNSEQQFIAKTGFSPDELRGKLVLDAGVGAGSYADVASRWGANVVGVDLSYAVEVSNRNFANRPNVFIAQADIGHLPFAPASFDFIFSIGVLHHTPDTRKYFKSLVPHLKPGGSIAIWVYPNEGDYLIREKWVPFVNKISPMAFHKWCSWFIPWIHNRAETWYAEVFRRVFPYSEQELGLENDILNTFDGYSPRYHGVHSPEEVEGWFREAGLSDIVRPSPWMTCVRGRRPL